MAFYIANNALALCLSSSSPNGTAALSKVMACSGAFSQTSSAASHLPSRYRLNVTHKNRERIDGEIKKKRKDSKGSSEMLDGGGGKKDVLPLAPPFGTENQRG